MAEINELATALNAFQAELVTVGKNSNNPFFKSKYADLADIMLTAQPVVTKHGLSVVQLLDNLDGKPALTTHLIHKSGQAVSATIPLILAKEDPQGVGSAITYMRRYGYAAALQIVIDEDDDGNRASSAQAKPQPKANSLAATDKQKELIVRLLASRKGVALENTKAWLTENYGLTGEMSKDDASMIIEDLMDKNSPPEDEYNIPSEWTN